MITRYSRPEMCTIWNDNTKYQIWLEIETHACQAQAELGIIPQSAANAIKEKGQFNIKQIEKIEQQCKHDVIAFLTNLNEYIGEQGRFVHQGMTSSDILDTTLSIQLMRSADIILNDIDDILKNLKKRATEHKMTIMIGRSHGIHAEPITFGLKLASHYAEFKRNKIRLTQAKNEIATCAISGAVGTFANINPKVEQYVAKKMGLTIEPISTQVIARDRHAMFFSVLAVIAGAIERLAITIRLMQTTEVAEAEEYFSKDQKGSSAMPHKRNPILSENISGLARIIRANAIPALENIALWHERDISHSSVERIIAPDTTILADFALARLSSLIKNLQVNPQNMTKNLNLSAGLYNSQRILLALTQKGATREQAYLWVQQNAMQAWQNNNNNPKNNFQNLLSQDENIQQYLNKKEINELFNEQYHLKHINEIFERVFN